jgi:hypothetical protein
MRRRENIKESNNPSNEPIEELKIQPGNRVDFFRSTIFDTFEWREVASIEVVTFFAAKNWASERVIAKVSLSLEWRI